MFDAGPKQPWSIFVQTHLSAQKAQAGFLEAKRDYEACIAIEKLYINGRTNARPLMTRIEFKTINRGTATARIRAGCGAKSGIRGLYLVKYTRYSQLQSV